MSSYDRIVAEYKQLSLDVERLSLELTVIRAKRAGLKAMLKRAGLDPDQPTLSGNKPVTTGSQFADFPDHIGPSDLTDEFGNPVTIL